MSITDSPCAMAETSKALPCPNHLTHKYHFEELVLRGGSNKQKYFRAMVFFYKKPGLTDEFFHEHWKSVHADLTMQVKDAGVDLVRYVQFHQEQKDKDALAPLLKASGGSMTLMPYDGAAEFYAESAEKFTKFFLEVYASPHIVGCGKRFVDIVKGYHVMVGRDNLIFGAGLPKVGSDGIMAGDARLNSNVEIEVKKSVDEEVKVIKDLKVAVKDISVVVEADLADAEA